MSIIPVKERIYSTLKDQKVDSFEVIPLSRPISFDHYKDWIDQGLQADMQYMAENSDVRERPQSEFPPMRSIIVFTESYFPIPTHGPHLFKNLKTAHYARNKDYHFWFREKLEKLSTSLKEQFPEERFQTFTDAVPLLERDYGAQAALGWVGKNTCLIHPKKGSLFFIGEILTSLEVSERPDQMHDFCGSCTACIDACPTQAITSDRVLDANKCIAYWNIENKSVPPVEMREQMGDWFFGCDICQTVCPWNIKWHKNDPNFPEPPSINTEIENELRFILESSNKKILKYVAETPLARAGGRGLKRNALIVIGNKKLKNLKPLVEAYLTEPRLGELAQWTLTQLS